ncbi:MAG TPA: hypothetical protein VJ963_00425 [Bacteroidales bacterium]|nr:hypothetical protein [Bacteroidales bacterium]
MKKSVNPFSFALALTIIIMAFSSCKGKKPAPVEAQPVEDTVAAKPDTGFTGIKKLMSGRYIVSETTYKNGIEQGLKKTFYMSGKVRMTFWYENGLRQDSSVWYYEEGQVFRVTPYINDTINGTQTQYYRTGEVKAILKYRKGLRVPFLEEYTRDGKLIKNYPELQIKTTDNYNTNGTYHITLSLSNKAQRVKYFRGNYTNGLFDTTRLEKIRTAKGIGSLSLKKTSQAHGGSVDVIAEILTNFGNNLLVHKKISLPYNDLN